MARKKHMDNRNLVVCKTFDDFSHKLLNTDIHVEDIVSYIEDITMCVYSLNLENIWGILGFEWVQVYPIPETEDYENTWNYIEHINADGTNVTEPKLSNLGMGYGRFNSTTIPFTIIPMLSDGFRITAFDSTFDNVTSSIIELQKSDWHNVTSINNLCPPNKSLKADLSGANITSATNLIRSGSNLYFIGDLSHIPANQIVLNDYGGTVTVDDNNEGWGIPYNSENFRFKYHYKGTKQARLDYLINFDFYTFRGNGDIIGITSDNNQVYITNAPYNTTPGYPNIHMLPYKKATDYADWHDLVAVPEEDKITLTIDYSKYNDTDTFSEHLMGGARNNAWGNTWYSSNDDCSYIKYMFNPIQYIGLPQDASIEAYNPHIVFASDNWPTYNQQIVEKTKQSGVNPGDLHSGMFMPHIMANITRKCPYTIDCSNISQLSLFKYGTFYIEDETALLKDNGIDILPTLTNEDLDIFDVQFSIPEITKSLYLPSVKSRQIYLGMNCVIGNESIIETSNLFLGGSPFIFIGLSNSTKTCIRLVPDSNGLISLNRGHDISKIEKVNSDYNFIEYGTHDANILKENTLIAFLPSDEYTLYHDLISCNQSSNLSIGRAIIESEFIFIYRSSITMTPNKSGGYNLTDYYNNQVKKIISGLQPKGDTTNDYTFTLWNELVNMLTQSEKDYIQNTCGYRIINQI